MEDRLQKFDNWQKRKRVNVVHTFIFQESMACLRIDEHNTYKCVGVLVWVGVFFWGGALTIIIQLATNPVSRVNGSLAFV